MTEEWTFNTLKCHFDGLRECDREAVKVAFANYEKRMDSTNEWRQALTDQQATFAQKEQTDLQTEEMKRRLVAIETSLATQHGKASGVAGLVGYIIAGSTLLLAIIVAWANGKLGG